MANEIQIKRRSEPITDDLEVLFLSETYKGETMDTEVKVGGEHLTWIAGNQIAEFLTDFRAVVEKYQI